MNYEKKLIREVKLKDGEMITDPKQIEKELENFSFVEGIEILQLNTEEWDSLEHDFYIRGIKRVGELFLGQ